jgi:hypothetical protein
MSIGACRFTPIYRIHVICKHEFCYLTMLHPRPNAAALYDLEVLLFYWIRRFVTSSAKQLAGSSNFKASMFTEQPKPLGLQETLRLSSGVGAPEL